MPITITIHIREKGEDMTVNSEGLGAETATWGEQRAGWVIKKALEEASLILMRENRNGALVERQHPGK